MNKYLVLVLACLSYFPEMTAQYITPGTGVTWNMDNLVTNSSGAVIYSGSEFEILNDITISANDTLRQNTNCTVRIYQNVLITIQGVLQFSPPDSILISWNPASDDFMGFRFEDSDASFFSHCTIEHSSGIKLVDSDVHFTGCSFRHNSNTYATGTIDLFQSSPSITGCSFILNAGPAVMSAANGLSSPNISGNFIYRNNTLNANMPQINLGTSNGEEPILIENNEIEGFYDKAGGIAVATLAGGSIDCIIDSNVIFNNRYGITVYGFDINSVISNNDIYDNNIENLPMQGGSGINFWGGTSNVSMVSGNMIHGNLWGITNTGDALPNMGRVDPDTINPGNNSFYDNGNLGVTYALYNNTPNDIFAENNYWGSYNLDSVAAVIFDYYDDETLGIVDYMPIQSPPTAVDEKFIRYNLVKICPNPSQRSIGFELPEALQKLSFRTRIFDEAGKPVLSRIIVNSSESIDISELQPGMYYVHLSNNKATFTGKFLKK